MANKKLIVKPRRGKYSLSSKQLQEFKSKSSLTMAGRKEPKSIAGQSITQLPDSFTQGTSGTSHNYPGKKIGKLANPSRGNQSDLFSSRGMETNSEILQGSGFEIGDIDGDEPGW